MAFSDESRKGANKMRGLLLKDIYNLRKVGKQYLLIFLFFVCYCFLLKNPSFFAMMAIMSTSMMILTSLGYDEAAGFDKYALTLPVEREDLVKVKYLLLLLLLGAGALIGLAGNVLINLFMKGEGMSAAEQMVSVGAVVSVFLIVYATMLPLVFKLGVERARMLLTICYIAVFVAVFLVFKLLVAAGLEGSITDERMIALAVGAAVAAVLYLLASYFVSVRIIRKREW